MESISASTSGRRGTQAGALRAAASASSLGRSSQGGKYKEKFTAMRERYDVVTSRREEMEKELAAAEERARKIQEEMDLLLDALSLAIETQPTLTHLMESDVSAMPTQPNTLDHIWTPGSSVPNGYHAPRVEYRQYSDGLNSVWPSSDRGTNGVGTNGYPNGYSNGHHHYHESGHHGAYEYLNSQGQE